VLFCGIRLFSKSPYSQPNPSPASPPSFLLPPLLSPLSHTNPLFNSCAAQKYTLPTLARLSLRKQGLHTNISVSTILSSARFAYAHTPDTESRMRAHYLALIVRSRSTFMRSGTMQMEMERGGLLFFDLFVALCNHMVSCEVDS
jgi:hypothetical protein